MAALTRATLTSATGPSVRSPHGLGSGHACRGAAVAGLHLHADALTLTRQGRVQEGGAGGRVCARWQDPRRRARLASAAAAAAAACSHHGELVGASGAGVVQVVRRGGGLEGAVLGLVGRVRRVRRRQVGVVPPCRRTGHGCRHGDAQGPVGDGVVGGCVGEGGGRRRVVDSGVREAAVRQGRQGGERSLQGHSRVTEGGEVRTLEGSQVVTTKQVSVSLGECLHRLGSHESVEGVTGFLRRSQPLTENPARLINAGDAKMLRLQAFRTPV